MPCNCQGCYSRQLCYTAVSQFRQVATHDVITSWCSQGALGQRIGVAEIKSALSILQSGGVRLNVVPIGFGDPVPASGCGRRCENIASAHAELP